MHKLPVLFNLSLDYKEGLRIWEGVKLGKKINHVFFLLGGIGHLGPESSIF